MLQAHSPNKENNSPSPHRHKKYNDAILEPSPQQQKRLKARLADYQFQLKKLQEDFAQFRLLSGLQKEKAVRKLREELEGEKSKNAEESRRWETRFGERQLQWEQQKEKYQMQIQRRYRREKDKTIEEMGQAHSQEVQRLITVNKRLTERHNSEIEQLKINHKSQLQLIQINHQQQIDAIKAANQEQLKQCEAAFSSQLNSKQEQRKQVESKIEEVKLTHDKTVQKYLRTIGSLQRQKHVLWEKKEDLQMKTKVLTHRYQEKTKETQQIRQNLVIEAAKVQQQKSKVGQIVEERYEKQRLRLLQQEYAKIESFQQKIQILQQNKETLQQQYQAMFTQLQQRHDARQPRKQDVVMIRDYKNQLIDQQKQMMYMHEQMKIIQMEKDNNQKNYNRIFTHQPRSRQKSLSHRPDRETGQWLQCQTYDLRALLKIHKK